jgi:signal transduction histidine kinase
MNGVLGMTDLLLNTELTADQRESLGMVKSSADALLTVINDILDFSKIEAGKMDLDPVPFSLRDQVGDALKALAPRAHAKGLELACDIPEDVPDLVVGDPGRLRQVLTNLAGNAVKFTAAGEVVVRAEVAADDPDAVRLRFAVSDTGIGIPADKLAAVFDPFTQADGSTTRKYGGTGLGLTISTRLVALMGGRIWVESELGKGSTFIFEARFERARGSIVRAVAAPVDLRGVPVLVVDDNATNRRVLVDTVRQWGAAPVWAESGREALAELRRDSASYEV